MRPGQKIRKVPGSGWGVRVIEPGFPPAGGWWDDNGAIGCCVGAYQGRGVANYAASLVNLANPGVNDLAEIGGGPPNWDAVNGWSGFLALLRCFDTGLVPAADQSWSALCQFTVAALNGAFLFAARSGGGRIFGAGAQSGGNLFVVYHNGGSTTVAPALAAGNLGIAGNQGYRNGIAEGAAIPPWGGASNFPCYLGALNNLGAALFHYDGAIQAFAVYDCTLAAPEMAAVAADMAAL